MSFSSIRQSFYSRFISLCLIVTFITTMVITPKASAGVMGLPQPGTMVNLSSSYVPLMITGLTIHPENPLLMDFIVNTGNSGMNAEEVKKESDRLIKYFLACLTIPENNQWVNLSPYEKDRIIPEDLGQTVLGQDMLAQDYLLKQLTASLIYPEKNLGKDFWDRVYTKANQMYGTTQIPMNTFNKVWILPDTAKVYEHKDTVFVVKSHLKVMLDADYLALSKHNSLPPVGRVREGGDKSINNLGSQIVRQIILPAIEQEVNQGHNFAQLRQIYNSMILALWFKTNLKQALLNQVYTDKSKVNGVNVDDPAIKEKIYNQYLQAYKKGVFNYIKEEVDQNSQQLVPRKYFSGGLTPETTYTVVNGNEAMSALSGTPGLNFKVFGLTQGANAAMNTVEYKPGDQVVVADDKGHFKTGEIIGGQLDGGIYKEVQVRMDGEQPRAPALFRKVDEIQLLSRMGNDPTAVKKSLAEFDTAIQSYRDSLHAYHVNEQILRDHHNLDAIQTLENELNEKKESLLHAMVKGRVDIELAYQSLQKIEATANAAMSSEELSRIISEIDTQSINAEEPTQNTRVTPTKYTRFIYFTSNNVPYTLLIEKQSALSIALYKGSGEVEENLLHSLISTEFDYFNNGNPADLLNFMLTKIKPAKREPQVLEHYPEILPGRDHTLEEGGQMAMIAEQMEVLKGAENEISKILDEQFQRGDITENVYKNAIKNTYKNLYEWTTDEDIYRIDPSIRQTNLDTIRQGRWDDLIEAYRQEVAFGTAGIRGKAVLTYEELQKFVKEGALGHFLKGPNTINAFKLLKTTAGVIGFAKETGRKKIVIGYDSRIGGEQFADMIARLFIAQSTPDYQFQIFLFDEASPFPELSFGITTDDVKGDIGILLSASHNPADYNGYKITLGSGAQLNQKSKDAVVAAIAKVKNSEIVLADSLADAKSGQIVWLGADSPLEGKNYYGFNRIDMHSLHVGQVKKFFLNPKAVDEYGKKVNIGYAAFNGAGFKAVPRLLKETGFTNFKVITKLQKLDGTFPAWNFGEQPDPGDPISADIAVKEFIQEYGQTAFDDLDILIGTDPDADRMGLIVKVPEAQQKFFGKYRLLSANDAWTLLLWYRLTMKKQMGLLQNPANHTVVFSHVTTDALEAVAREFGIEPSGKMLDMTGVQDRGDYLSGRRTWVGFTYLSEALEDMEQAGKYVEMLAEESNGVSIQGHTKEKDGTLAAVLLSEVAAYAKSQNTTIFELLDKIYSQIGHYATANKPLPRVGSFEKAAGISEKIKIIQKSEQWGILANQRAGTADPFMIAGKKVIGAVPFASGRIDKSHYEGVPDEGVRFFFEDETMKPGDDFTNSRNYITIRASGTSQALRFYTQIFSKDVTPERKAFNYHEAERIALEAQKQILEDVGLAKHLTSVTRQLATFNAPVVDRAALAKSPEGGIDLNSRNLKMETQGQKVKITFDAAMIAQFRRGDFSGVRIKILDVVPINLMPLLGLKEDEESGQLAKA